eukprot:CAMPEP_0174831406 /NCGR_PEP_ID=MMETSP1114-20130205/3071_1 /TAXON_ID=312471 /ORGANISM="Neobodo designis, Strain CCAP 1951/1" /LENGTH=598 /DNA_ID=CAMNT_0016065229 /DNA_START=47 /DNA_END=1843 /DNA_ORIENTATION=-
MSTTLPHVRADLESAEKDLAEAQEALIEALNSRSVRTDTMQELEAAVEEATRRRDDLRSTRDFIITRERERGESSEGKFESVLYLSQRAPDFTMEDIGIMTGRAQQFNEGAGITGILYVFDEWFASFLEGPERDVQKLVRKIRADPRHTLFRIVDRNLNSAAGKRLYPKDALKVVWCREANAVASKPWMQIIRHLENQMNFTAYIPTAPVPARGVGSRTGRWFLIDIVPSVRYTDHISRLDQTDTRAMVASLTSVRDAVRTVVERIPGASVVTPNNNTRILSIVPANTPGDTVLTTLLSLRDAILAAESAYFPHISALLSQRPDDAAADVDGTTTVVGPAMRRLRILGDIAMQEDRPVVIDTVLKDDLVDGTAATSVGWFEFDKVPAEVFAPAGLTGDSPLATWGAYVDHQLRMRAKVRAKRMSIAGGSTAAGQSLRSWGTTEGAVESTIATSGGAGAATAAPATDPTEPLGFSRVPSTVDPESIMTAEKAAHRPVVGGITEAELRQQFNQCQPRESDGTIAVSALQSMLYDVDFMGAPPPVHELRQSLVELGVSLAAVRLSDADYDDEARPTKEEDTSLNRVNFDQFAVLWCRALLR